MLTTFTIVLPRLAFLLPPALFLPPLAAAQVSVPLFSKSPLNDNAASDLGSDRAASIAASAAGTVITVWDSDENIDNAIGIDRDILFSRSTDAGLSWSTPHWLNSDAVDDPGEHDTAPCIATDNLGRWICVWVSDRSLGGPVDLDIRASTSIDNGLTWSPPVHVNSAAASDEGHDDAPAIATDGNGNWVAVWRTRDSMQGSIGADGDILFSISSSLGAFWSPQQILNSNAASDSGADSKPAIATDRAGAWVVAWRSTENLGGTIGADPDILCARSLNNGASWSSPAPLNSSAATDGAAVDDLPRLVATSPGNFIAVWSSTATLGGTIGSDEDILFARSTSGGTAWSVAAPLNSSAAADGSATDREADIACNSAGHVLVVFTSNNTLNNTIGSDNDILATQSLDDGATWTQLERLASSAAGDDGSDDAVRAAWCSADGGYVVAWESTSTMGGTIGNDRDILCVQGELSGGGRVCAGDISPIGGDSVVNIDDLTQIILNWGTSNAIADITDDGNVDIDDLTAVILGWGPCR